MEIYQKLGLTLLTLLGIDLAWITFSRGFYPYSGYTRAQFAVLLVLTEILVTAGISIAVETFDHVWLPVYFALWVYGVFNITSLATNKEWSFVIAIVDTGIGILLYQAAFSVYRAA